MTMNTDDFEYYPSKETTLERCRAYIVYQLRGRKRPLKTRGHPPAGPAVTISYETGAGGHEVAHQLAGILQKTEPAKAAQWTVFDRQLVDEMLIGTSSTQGAGPAHAGRPAFLYSGHSG